MMNMNILLDAIKENAPEMEVMVTKIQKGNVTLTGITIGTGNVRPTVYMEYYENIFDGNNYKEIAREILKTVNEAKMPDLSEDYLDWEYAKTHLKLCIAPKGTNDRHITYPYLDLELYVRVIVNKTEDGIASYKVTEEIFKTWNIKRETLLHAAIDCTRPMYYIQSLSDAVFGFIPECELPMIVIQTKDYLNGASAIYCKDILKQVADMMNDDLVILPSSTHEIICVPADLIDIEEANQMVQVVNKTELEPKDVLSNHVYIFHKDTMEITY